MSAPKLASTLRRSLGFMIGLTAWTSLSAAAASSEPHVTARFVTAADRAGTVAGVELTMAPGWHVYWRHPGEAGLATEVGFELPPGVTAGELAWPLPVRFESPGGITSYGYRERVVLAAPITSPATVVDAEVAVGVSWLACHDVCVLGEARVSGRLGGTSSGFDPAAWRATLPVTGPPPCEVRVTGALGPGARRAAPVVWLSFPAAAVPGQVELFPAPGPRLKVSDVRLGRRGGLARVDLEVVRLDANDPPPPLPAVLVVTDGGERRGYRVSIPVAGGTESKGD